MRMNINILRKNLKLLRTLHGMSQEALSEKINITRSTYSSYETGTKIPDIQSIDALAALYNVSFESLINHDLSKGLLRKIYFETEDRQLAKLLNNYESLSIASKNVITERLEVILERESVFYREYTIPEIRDKK